MLALPVPAELLSGRHDAGFAAGHDAVYHSARFCNEALLGDRLLLDSDGARSVGHCQGHEVLHRPGYGLVAHCRRCHGAIAPLHALSTIASDVVGWRMLRVFDLL